MEGEKTTTSVITGKSGNVFMEPSAKPFTEMFTKTFDALNLGQKEIPGFSEGYVRAALNYNWVPDDRRIQRMVAGLRSLALKIDTKVRPVIPELDKWINAARLQPEDRRPGVARFRTVDKLRSQKASAKASSTPPQSLVDIEKYAEIILRRYSHLPLEIFDAASGRYRELPFFDLYVPPDVRECQQFLPRVLEAPKEQFQRLEDEIRRQVVESDDIAEAMRRYYVSQTGQNVVSVLDGAANSKVVVLGALGAGKSSLLRYMAVRWAKSIKSGKGGDTLPILIELKLYGEYAAAQRGSHDFIEFLDHGAGALWRFAKDRLKELLTRGDVIVLLDGLDEILDRTLRDEILTGIVRLTSDYPNVRIVVTSRLIGYGGDILRQAGFSHFMLQDFDTSQVSNFIENWEKTSRAAGSPDNLNALRKNIAESATIGELAGSPFLLTLMAAIAPAPEDLPRRRTELLELCSNMLLGQWKVEEALRNDPDLFREAMVFGIGEKKAILRRITSGMAEMTVPKSPKSHKKFRVTSSARHPSQLANIIPVAELEKRIVESIENLTVSSPLNIARALVRQFRERNGILCFAGAEHYSFVHRAFFEYFCADNIRHQFTSGKIRKKELEALFGLCWEEESWQEVLSFVCGMVDSVTAEFILTRLLKSHTSYYMEDCVFFVAKCFKETKLQNESPLGRTINKILLKISKYGPPKAEPFPLDIPRDYEEDIKDNLRDQWREENEQREAYALRASKLLVSLFSEQTDLITHMLTLADTGRFFGVREFAIRTLGRTWKNEEGIFDYLMRRAKYARHEYTRAVALETLAQNWQGDASVLEFLKMGSTSDREIHPRQVAVRAIGDGWRGDGAVLQWLKEEASQNYFFTVGAAAVECVARNNRDESTLSWLKQIVNGNFDTMIQERAIEQVAEYWNERTDIFRLIVNVASSDMSEMVREAALIALREKWPRHSETLQLFKSLFSKDSSGPVRQQAILGLWRNWKNDPETLILLKSAARRDSYWGVRGSAMRALATDWKQDPETFAIVMAGAEDAFLNARIEAHSLLHQNWPNDPRVKDFDKRASQAAGSTPLQEPLV